MELYSKSNAFQKARAKDIVLRVFFDYGLVHLCMLTALGLSVFYHTAIGEGDPATRLVRRFAAYYSTYFSLLSCIFPIVFWANGFYTRVRGYHGRRKGATIIRGAVMSVMAYLCANYLFFPNELVERSVILIFCVLIAGSVIGVRLLKDAIAARLSTAPAGENGASPRKSVLVVGGAGYIGSVLVRQLLEKGYKVRVLDKLVYGDAAIASLRSNPNFELLVGDCRNIRNVVAAVKNVDSIIHLAAIVGDPACDQDRTTALEINYAATRMMVEIAKGNGVERFVFASSCSVYGATDSIMDENSRVEPISLYGETKVDCEQALLEARSERFHPVILRLATVFGHSYRARFDLVVNLLAAKAGQESAITIFNGEQWRPFIYVSDAARGFVRALEAPISAVDAQIFNLGDSSLNCRLSDIGQKIKAVFPNTRVEHVDNTDQRNYRVSFEKIRRLGFTCTVSLEDGILELKRVIEGGLIGDYKDVRFNNQKFLQAAGSPEHTDETDEHVMAAFNGRKGCRHAVVG